MRKFMMAALAMVLVSVAAMAQNNNGGRGNFNPAEAYSRMAERMAKQMKLSDDKTEVFKVLYLDYQTARRNAANPRGENAENERVDLDKITDAQATELIQKQLAAQEAQLAVDKEYLPKFLEILTPAQVAQIYVTRGIQRQQGAQQRRPGGQGGFGGGPRGGQGGFDGGF